MCVCARARARVRACVRACACVWVRVCVNVSARKFWPKTLAIRASFVNKCLSPTNPIICLADSKLLKESDWSISTRTRGCTAGRGTSCDPIWSNKNGSIDGFFTHSATQCNTSDCRRKLHIQDSIAQDEIVMYCVLSMNAVKSVKRGDEIPWTNTISLNVQNVYVCVFVCVCGVNSAKD